MSRWVPRAPWWWRSGTAATGPGPSPRSGSRWRHCGRCWLGRRRGWTGRRSAHAATSCGCPPGSRLTVAAFGPAAVRLAARCGDRMVISLPTVVAAERLAGRLRDEARSAGRPVPPLAAWLPVAVDGGDAAREQIRRTLGGYLAAPGYAEMFQEAGFGDVVALARRRAHPREVLDAVPDDLVDSVAVLGDEPAVRDRLAAYGEHVDELVVLPCSTDDDPAGARTLRALARALSIPEEES